MTPLMCKQKEKEIQTTLLLKTFIQIVIKNSLFSSKIVHFSAIGSIFSAVSTIIAVKIGHIARIFQFSQVVELDCV